MSKTCSEGASTRMDPLVRTNWHPVPPRLVAAVAFMALLTQPSVGVEK